MYESRGGPFGGAGGFGGFDFGGGFSPFGNMGGFGSAGNASDLFEQLFGGAGRSFGGGFGGRSSMDTRGDDIETSVNIPFLDAAKGRTVNIFTTPLSDCHSCKGNGLKRGKSRTTCRSCGGAGTRTFVIQGGFQVASTCQACGGSGSTVAKGDECNDCDGIGKVKDKSKVEVKIPAGVEDGMKVRVTGAGDAPLSGKGPKGDLYVRINVQPSKDFKRQGMHIFHNAKIPLHVALLGGRHRIPTLDGEVDIRVPSGTQPGEEMVLKGKGVSRVGRLGDKGDLMVGFQVQMPRNLTPLQREIMEEFAATIEDRPITRKYPQVKEEDKETKSKEEQTNESDKDNEKENQSDNTKKVHKKDKNEKEDKSIWGKIKDNFCPPSEDKKE